MQFTGTNRIPAMKSLRKISSKNLLKLLPQRYEIGLFVLCLRRLITNIHRGRTALISTLRLVEILQKIHFVLDNVYIGNFGLQALCFCYRGIRIIIVLNYSRFLLCLIIMKMFHFILQLYNILPLCFFLSMRWWNDFSAWWNHISRSLGRWSLW